MSRKKNNIQVGATPGKLAVVGVLATTLVFIIVQQLPEATSVVTNPNTSTTHQPPKSITTPQQHRPTALAGEKEVNKRNKSLAKWPEPNLAETLVNNPFTPPNWAVDRTSGTNQSKPTALSELQKLGATIVVISNGKKSATIGNNKYIVGDVLAGHRVTDITTQGLHLEKL